MGNAIDDPLLAAIIGKLPAPGATWSKADRINWLRMFVMAANVAYGDAPGVTVSDIEERAPLRFAPVLVEAGHDRPAPGAAPAAEPAGPGRFVIDADGFALRDNLPIDPEDVPPGAIIWDERRGAEQGDLASVYWKRGGIIKGTQPAHLKLQAA